MTDTPRLKLRERGNVYVTLAALDAYLDFLDGSPGDEEARRELTRYACDATLREESTPGRPALYRYRSRSVDLDLSLRVVDEPPLAIVVALDARRY